jgi:nucleoside-diphosphate-sugar epimerase
MNDQEYHVVIGAGALGLGVARVLIARGYAVRLVSRSGKAHVPYGAEVVKGDVTDVEDAIRVCKGAAVVYHCTGAPYGTWRKTLPPIMDGVIEGASAAGAKLVYGDNLYMYGRVAAPLTETLAAKASGSNGQVRARLAETLLAAHQQGKVQAALGRASDFYGPHARNSKAGDGIFLRALKGKPAQVLGDPDAPHAYTFIDDFAEALVTLGEHDEALGNVWHVPNAPILTTREFVAVVFEQLGKKPKLTIAPKLAIRLMGTVNPTLRAVGEVLYQSETPWVVDHHKFEQAFGASPTPHHQAIRATLDWYRDSVLEAR